jgi:hypothetical protein
MPTLAQDSRLSALPLCREILADSRFSLAGRLSIPANSDVSMLVGSTVTTQVFRLKAEVGFYDLGFKQRWILH